MAYTLDATGDEVPSVTFTNFDINDPATFLIATPANNSNYARYRMVTDRFDKIGAVRGDVTYDLEGTFFQSIKVGGRLSDHRRTQDANNNADVAIPIALRRPHRRPAGLGRQHQLSRAVLDVQLHGRQDQRNSWALFDNDCLLPHLYRPRQQPAARQRARA